MAGNLVDWCPQRQGRASAGHSYVCVVVSATPRGSSSPAPIASPPSSTPCAPPLPTGAVGGTAQPRTPRPGPSPSGPAAPSETPGDVPAPGDWLGWLNAARGSNALLISSAEQARRAEETLAGLINVPAEQVGSCDNLAVAPSSSTAKALTFFQLGHESRGCSNGEAGSCEWRGIVNAWTAGSSGRLQAPSPAAAAGGCVSGGRDLLGGREYVPNVGLRPRFCS
jgi:hypothetical protein